MTTYNLASLLENSAAAYPEREAIVFPATGRRLTYAEVDTVANMVANLLVSKGIQPGDKVALSCPNLPYFSLVYWGILKAGGTVVPLNVLLKGREVAYHLADSDAKAYFCFQGTPELPIGQEGYAGFQEDGACEHFFVITAALDGESPFDGVETFGQALGGMEPTFDSVGDRRGRHRGHPLHLRHHREAEGRRAPAPQHARQRLLAESLFGFDPESPETFLCVLPLFHSFGQTVIQNAARRRQHGRDAAEVRGRLRPCS